MATQATEVSTGVLKITPKPIDMNAKGSLRKMRDILRTAEAAKRGESASIDRMVDIIVENSEIEAPEGVDVHEALLDELTPEEFNAILKRLRGGDAVFPTNGD